MRTAFRQKANDPGTLQLYVYDDIYKGLDMDLETMEISPHESSAEFFRNALESADTQNVEIYINSLGGDPFEAYAMAAALDRSGKHTTAVVDGYACSAASLIFMACEKRVMYPHSMLMVHNVSMTATGNAAQLRAAADSLDEIMRGNRQLYLERVALTEEELTAMLDAETWIPAQDALDMGFATELRRLSSGKKEEACLSFAASADEERAKRIFETACQRMAETAEPEAVEVTEEAPAPAVEPEAPVNPLQKMFAAFIKY